MPITPLQPTRQHATEPDQVTEASSLAGALGAGGTPGAESTRGLLTTVLGEFVLPTGGQVWTQTLLEALALLGIREKAARQAVARMHERGWLDRNRRGRQTRWTLTPPTTNLLNVGAERIYGFGQEARPWDGEWILLLASVPETDRQARYRMNSGLRWAGFGSLGQGSWISPWTDRESSAVKVLADLNVEATSFVSRLGQLGDGARLANEAWELPSLRVHYEQFLADTSELAGRHIDREQAVVELARLVHRWRQFPFADPDLPGQLLPTDWPGPEASARFSQLREQLLAPATSWWAETENRFSGP